MRDLGCSAGQPVPGGATAGERQRYRHANEGRGYGNSIFSGLCEEREGGGRDCGMGKR